MTSIWDRVLGAELSLMDMVSAMDKGIVEDTILMGKTLDVESIDDLDPYMCVHREVCNG